MATGETIAKAARSLGISRQSIDSDRKKHGRWFQIELLAARVRRDAIDPSTTPEASAVVVKRIQQITALEAAGKLWSEISEAIGITPNELHDYKDRHKRLWQTELARAMEAAVIVVRRQAGTDAVIEDPAAFIAQALAVERWCSKKGRQLLPEGERTTLGSFYRTWYKPNRLQDKSPLTVESYAQSVKYWQLLTGDLPLEQVTPDTLYRFRDCLQKLSGIDRVVRMAPTTVGNHLKHVQAILNKAGPPDRGNRDATGLIPGRCPGYHGPAWSGRILTLWTPSNSTRSTTPPWPCTSPVSPASSRRLGGKP